VKKPRDGKNLTRTKRRNRGVLQKELKGGASTPEAKTSDGIRDGENKQERVVKRHEYGQRKGSEMPKAQIAPEAPERKKKKTYRKKGRPQTGGTREEPKTKQKTMMNLQDGLEKKKMVEKRKG